MLKAITAAITARASLIKTCLSRDLGRGDSLRDSFASRAFADITQFLTKS